MSIKNLCYCILTLQHIKRHSVAWYLLLLLLLQASTPPHSGAWCSNFFKFFVILYHLVYFHQFACFLAFDPYVYIHTTIVVVWWLFTNLAKLYSQLSLLLSIAAHLTAYHWPIWRCLTNPSQLVNYSWIHTDFVDWHTSMLLLLLLLLLGNSNPINSLITKNPAMELW